MAATEFLRTGQKTEHVMICAETGNSFSRQKQLFLKSLLSAKAKYKFELSYHIFVHKSFQRHRKLKKPSQFYCQRMHQDRVRLLTKVSLHAVLIHSTRLTISDLELAL